MSAPSVAHATIALDVRNVRKRFGGFVAVDDVSLSLMTGERRALIGPNGAGKTTLFNLLSGRLPPDEGDVLYNDKSIVGVSPSEICRRGMARTFQITSVFTRLSAIQNVQTALYTHRRRSHWLLRGAAGVLRDEALGLLDMVGIRDLAFRPAGLLSYGDQKRLELAMVMALEPRLLLLDEPTAGVELNTRRELVALIKDLCARQRLTLLFCEHDMDAVFSIADKITVLHQGQVLAEGAPDDISGHPDVREIYLGRAHGGPA